jgi:hypothetical protein
VMTEGPSTPDSFVIGPAWVDWPDGLEECGAAEVEGLVGFWASDTVVVGGDVEVSGDTIGGVLGWMTPSTSFRLGAEMPPAAGKPSRSLVARQVLYLTKGNRSLTSSIVMSFLSLLLRCGRVINERSMGSASPRCRALFR